MSAAAWGGITASVWFALLVVAHWAAMHLGLASRLSRAALLLLAAAAAATLACGGLLVTGATEAIGFAVTALLTLACLFVLYMPFVFTIATSLSVQSCILLMRHGGRLPLAQLQDRFAGASLFQGRLDTMVGNGWLERRGPRYLPTPRGRRVAALFGGIKRLWRLGPGG